jgi:Holliday junction resolvase RusA-like endonuclease
MAHPLKVKGQEAVRVTAEPARLRLELDFVPPSVNELYTRNPITGRRYPTVMLQLYQKRFGAAVNNADIWNDALPERTPFALSLRVNVNRKSDIDNRIKALMDCLVANSLVPDDRWCDRLTISRDCTIKGVVIEAEAL